MSININTKSWHFRLIRNFDSKPKSNLCGYFWQVVKYIILSVFIVSVGIILVSAFAFFSLYIIGLIAGSTLASVGIFPASFIDVPNTFNWRYVVLSIVIDAVIAAFIYGKHKYDEYRYEKAEKSNGTEKSTKPNLLFEFVKAKKQKICPLINFVDPTDKK